MQKIAEAGHEIGNHTYSHIELIKASSPDIKTEVERTREIVKEITGQTTVLFRPPWGLFDGRSLAELAMRKFDAVLWSVDSRDWSRPGIESIKKNILSKARNGSIILFELHHQGSTRRIIHFFMPGSGSICIIIPLCCITET